MLRQTTERDLIIMEDIEKRSYLSCSEFILILNDLSINVVTI